MKYAIKFIGMIYLLFIIIHWLMVHTRLNISDELQHTTRILVDPYLRIVRRVIQTLRTVTDLTYVIAALLLCLLFF